jgi:hypothetical protein
MPVIFKKKLTPVRVGMKCDACGIEDVGNANDFAVNHTFGYGSPSDMTSVSFALCDTCLLAIVLEKIPQAVFKEWEEGAKIVSHEQMKSRLDGFMAC